MAAHFHALVWIDHREAKVFHFDADSSQSVTVHNSHAHQNLHHKANSIDSGHVAVDKEYLHRVVTELAAAGAILIVGPGSAKTAAAQSADCREYFRGRVDRSSDRRAVAGPRPQVLRRGRPHALAGTRPRLNPGAFHASHPHHTRRRQESG
jgi:hypothetical protein